MVRLHKPISLHLWPRCHQKWICRCGVVSPVPLDGMMTLDEMRFLFQRVSFSDCPHQANWLSFSSGQEKTQEASTGLFSTGALSTGTHLVNLPGWCNLTAERSREKEPLSGFSRLLFFSIERYQQLAAWLSADVWAGLHTVCLISRV